MPAAAIVTLVLVGVLIAALAVYLVIILIALRRVSFTLGTVVLGGLAIAHRTAPLAEIVGSVAGEVLAIDDALAAVADPTGSQQAS